MATPPGVHTRTSKFPGSVSFSCHARASGLIFAVPCSTWVATVSLESCCSGCVAVHIKHWQSTRVHSLIAGDDFSDVT